MIMPISLHTILTGYCREKILCKVFCWTKWDIMQQSFLLNTLYISYIVPKYFVIVGAILLNQGCMFNYIFIYDGFILTKSLINGNIFQQWMPPFNARPSHIIIGILSLHCVSMDTLIFFQLNWATIQISTSTFILHSLSTTLLLPGQPQKDTLISSFTQRIINFSERKNIIDRHLFSFLGCIYWKENCHNIDKIK